METIIGVGWLKEQRAVWDFSSNEINIDGMKYRLLAGRKDINCMRVIAVDDITVPPRSECVLPTKVVFHGMSAIGNSSVCNWMTEATEPMKGLHVLRTLLSKDATSVPVRVMNSTKFPITVKARMIVADVNPVDIMEQQSKLPDERDKYESLIANLIESVNDKVDAGTKHTLKDLISEFKEVFSIDDNDLGRTSLVAHAIDTGNAKPVRQPLRRHPPAHQDAIHQHVASMLEQEIIEPAQSAWASNVVLVKKKDNSLRCCIDYRQVNSATEKVAYPLPRTDMCLDAMAGAQWFSTFDLRSSYHQVPLKVSDADKTAFICREGVYRFKTMPFGLCNAGTTFQRLMDIVLSGFSFEICLAYLDDIIFFSKDEQSHVERLRLVFTRLQSAGLKLKPSKCHLLQRSVSFLGHVVSPEGIATNPQKIDVIISWPIPKDAKEVRAFLGICGYYRRYVEGFSAIAKPLHELTEKSRRFDWTSESQAAFDNLKGALTSPPILKMPNDTDEFVIDTDSSNWAIGAVLSQRQQGTERVIAYARQKLSKCEMNYCVTRRELLAIVYFLKYFRHYLLGRRFVVRTDHAALQWLRRAPEVFGQQARWMGEMEQYDFQIVHRPGLRHGNADAMSRIPCRTPDCCEDKNTAEYDVRICHHGATTV